jgi:hypothetical protein
MANCDILMKAFCVWPPMRAKFCCCDTVFPEVFEDVGINGVIVKPASATGGALAPVNETV